jgi:beta-mannosidase
MIFTAHTTLRDALLSSQTTALVFRHIPYVSTWLQASLPENPTLKELAVRFLPAALVEATLSTLLNDLNNLSWSDSPGASLDDLDNASYRAGPAPLSILPQWVEVRPGALDLPQGSVPLSLSGAWLLAEGEDEEYRFEGEWTDGIPASVPGSVHTALVAAGRLPEPTIGRNQEVARLESFKTWWMKRTFPHTGQTHPARLIFGGVANRCTVWLNGQELGRHEGMFGGPEFEIGDGLRDQNTLVVRLDSIPNETTPVSERSSNPDNNLSWRRTVVFNNVYGWHYSNLPSLGIWRPVEVVEAADVSIVQLFLATRDAQAGSMSLVVGLVGKTPSWSGMLRASIEPANFEGTACHFEIPVQSDTPEHNLHLRFNIPDPHLWWPVDLGKPNLYHLQLSFESDTGDQPDSPNLTFGIRTVEMAPLPGGPTPDKFNWTFVINGEPHFVKGTGWCTMDPLMDFSYERYERLVRLAAMQHVQMLRCWGSGMPETNEFYALCDQYGIMVLQEWPTAWNSHLDQPYEMLEETIRLNTLRLRNHPSLVMWGAGNESTYPFGPAIDMMGRLSIELDGTRAFHRGEPWGGSLHNYVCYWDRQPLDHNLKMQASFFGEFGLACMPHYESVQRYLPDEEKNLWPAPPNGGFAYHTPIFNTREDISRLTQYARYFVPADCSMEEFTIGSQLSQVVGIRHTLERARTRWPFCTGALYYKMNDNFPAASWACVDWYGAPKIGHYFFQDAFAPLHVCVLFSSVNNVGTPLSLPVYILDDADELQYTNWRVIVRAYDDRLREIARETFEGSNSIDTPLRLGVFSLDWEQTDTVPLLVVAEVFRAGDLADRSFYWVNYEPVKGCLFQLPSAHLAAQVGEGTVTVQNGGLLPAVAVHIARPGYLDTFFVSDNYFWLDPGEVRTVEVSDIVGLTVAAWNCTPTPLDGPASRHMERSTAQGRRP